MAATIHYAIFVILILIFSAKCERLKDKMYDSFDGAYCFRRMTADGQHGCSSSLYGDTGVVHFIDTPQDIDWLVNEGKAGPYVPIVPLQLFKRTDMLKLKNSGKVSGMLLWNNVTLSSFSTEDTCPNRHSGLNSEACSESDAWNPYGSSLIFEHWGFPMAYIKNTETIHKLRQCFNKFNTNLNEQDNERLCAVQIQSHMFGAVNTPTCMRRHTILDNLKDLQMCDPLGDLNIYQFANPTMKNEDRSVVVLATRQDGFSMFDDLTPGAMSPITSLVTLLTAASYLKEMNGFQVKDKNLLLVLFNGEAFDYIGSSRMVYDITNGNFPTREKPMTLDQIGLFVELDQISGDSLFYHTHSENNPLAKKFIQTLGHGLEHFNMKLTGTKGKFPPASIQRFLKGDSSIPAVLISNYNSSYNNPFYNSLADNATALGYVYANGSEITEGIQKNIDEIGLSIAKTLYYVLQNESYIQYLQPKRNLVDEMLHCYLETQNCTLFQTVSNSTSLNNTPASVYVSVAKQNNTITKLTGLVLAYLTGDRYLDYNKSQCLDQKNPDTQFYWMSNMCVESSFGYQLAYSPAFEVPDYDWKSNSYSSWTESIWIQLGLRMFVIPPWKREIVNVVTGVIVLIVSFAAVFYINSKANILFNRTVLQSTEAVL